MKNTTASYMSTELIRRWREQIARQRRRRAAQGPRPLAAIGYLARGPVYDGVADLRQLLLVSLFDQRTDDSALVMRVAGFSCSAIPWGVRIGGQGQSRFEKDLGRAPGFGANGRRFNLAREDVLTLALDLDRDLDKHLRFPHLPCLREPRWPALWAAFGPQAAANLEGAGPELEQVARRSGRSPQVTFRATNRVIRGLEAFPLEFVSHAWRQCGAIYVDLGGLRRRQVIALDHGMKNLCGHAGAIEFDLVNTRFSTASNPAAGQ